MKICLSDLYRKVSAQIRKELRQKEAESRLHLYKYYIPLIVNAISESIKIDANKLSEAFEKLAERHVKGETIYGQVLRKEDKITEGRIQEEIKEKAGVKITKQNTIQDDYQGSKRSHKSGSKKQNPKRQITLKGRAKGAGVGQKQTTLDALDASKR
ncbi:MAG TPA: hypothetical protein VE619_01145, partial [Nitrososphaeraceae archaeon]|nr:hypothetical protein [Nitrososphaeraceae archaeon]